MILWLIIPSLIKNFACLSLKFVNDVGIFYYYMYMSRRSIWLLLCHTQTDSTKMIILYGKHHFHSSVLVWRQSTKVWRTKDEEMWRLKLRLTRKWLVNNDMFLFSRGRKMCIKQAPNIWQEPKQENKIEGKKRIEQKICCESQLLSHHNIRIQPTEDVLPSGNMAKT